MRTLLAFAALALAAHCACAAPMSIAAYSYQPMVDPYVPESIPPPPPPPPFEERNLSSSDLDALLARLLERLITLATKMISLDNWDHLRSLLSDSTTSSHVSWTSEPSNPWSNRSVEPWSPQPEPMPYPMGGPDSTVTFPSSPDFPKMYGKERPAATGGSVGSSIGVMGFPTIDLMAQGGNRPMYNSMEMKASMASSDMKGMPPMGVMQGMGGMQGIMGVPVMDSVQSVQAMPSVPKVSQARPPVQPGKPSVAAPFKPAVVAAMAPGKTAVVKQGAPAAMKPMAPGAVKPMAPLMAGGPVMSFNGR